MYLRRYRLSVLLPTCSALLVCTLGAGCSYRETTENLDQLSASQNQIQLSMVNQTRQMESLSQQINQLSIEAQTRDETQLRQQKQAKQAIAMLEDKVCPPVEVPVCPELPDIGDMVIMGGVETFWIKPAEVYLEARIDTGATVSSINALDIEKFERDGDQWVRFKLPDPESDAIKQLELPVKRFTLVRQASAEDLERRPVIDLAVGIGKRSFVTEFSLRDRSQMTYPLLIGRTFLQDRAIVDVSRQDVFPLYKPKERNSKATPGKKEHGATSTPDDINSP